MPGKVIGGGALRRAKELAEQGSDDEGNVSGEKPGVPVDPRLSRLQLVSVDRIKASRFQHRDELDFAEDKEYQQLYHQVQADLDAQGDVESRTIEHVFVVMPDPEDSSKFILAKGGHRRYQVCLDLGVKEIYVWIKEYDETTLATGTYEENKGRRKTSWIEDARTYEDIMKTLGWNQTEVASYLHVEGGQPHVSRCLSMLEYHPDLQRMLSLSEERGMRATKELNRLVEHFGRDKAVELWTPLIAAFLNFEIYTDDIEQKVKQWIGEEPTKAKKADAEEFPVLRRQRLAQRFRKQWQGLRKECGDEPLDDTVRKEIEAVYEEAKAILGLS